MTYRTARSDLPFSHSMQNAELSRVPVCAHLSALSTGAGGDVIGVGRKRLKGYVQIIIYWYNKAHGKKH